jgi:hypothetical protein
MGSGIETIPYHLNQVPANLLGDEYYKRHNVTAIHLLRAYLAFYAIAFHRMIGTKSEMELNV